MPYHHHGFDFRRERSRERIHIKLGQYSPFGTGEADDRGSDCDCIKFQSDVKRGQAAKQQPFSLGHPRLVQQNINLISGVQDIRRRVSRPGFPILNANYFDQWVGQYDRCVHGCDSANACHLCGRNQRGRARSCHGNHDEDDLYNIGKAIKESRKAHEAQQKKQKEAQEAQEAKDRKMAEGYKFFFSKAEPKLTSPNLLFRQNDILEQRKKEIRREIEQCDADMKCLHEGAAREAQFRGHQDRKTVLEHEQAGRFDEWGYNWEFEETAHKTKRQPKSILVNKKVRFLGRMQ